MTLRFPIRNNSAWIDPGEVVSNAGASSILSVVARAVGMRRPRYYNATSGGTTITVPASASAPAYFLIGGTLYTQTSSLTCNLTRTGVSGLDTGSVAANKPYYLYGIAYGSEARLVASASAPTVGPTGYSDWTYIGACATGHAAATMPVFNAQDGFVLFDDRLSGQTHTGDTNSTAKTFAAMPATATKAYVEAYMIGPYGSYVQVSGASGGDPVAISGSVAGTVIIEHGWSPVITAQTLYLRTTDATGTAYCELYGWQENPMEYQ